MRAITYIVGSHVWCCMCRAVKFGGYQSRNIALYIQHVKHFKVKINHMMHHSYDIDNHAACHQWKNMGGGLSAGLKAVLTWFNVIIRCNILLRAHTGSVKSRDSHIEHVKDNSYNIDSHAGSTGDRNVG